MTIQELFRLEDEQVFKAASGLAGGIGRTHHACGALIGGSMALSLKYGRERNEVANVAKLYDSVAKVEQLVQWFEKEFGSVDCKDITTSFLGEYLDSRIQEQREKAMKLGLYEKCSDLVGKTARKVAEMMLE